MATVIGKKTYHMNIYIYESYANCNAKNDDKPFNLGVPYLDKSTVAGFQSYVERVDCIGLPKEV